MHTNRKCGICETPIPAFELTQAVTFPEDAEAVLDLVQGRLNVYTCPICETSTSLQPCLIVADPGKRRLAISGITVERCLEMLKQSGADAFLSDATLDIQYCDDYQEIAKQVLGWIEQYLAQATYALFHDEDIPVDSEGLKLHQTPLALLIFHGQLRGEIPLKMVTDPPVSAEEARRLLNTLYSAVVIDLVRDSYIVGLRRGGLGSFLSVVEHRIPSRCFTSDVLNRFAEECVELDTTILGDPVQRFRAFKAEYCMAVVHAIADQPNPRKSIWAWLMLTVFRVLRANQSSNLRVLSVPPEVLRRTISFETLWNVAMKGEVDDLHRKKGYLDEVFAFAESLGYASRINETIRAAIDIHFPDSEEWSDKEMVESLIASVESTFVEQQLDHSASPVIVAEAVARFVEAMLQNGRSKAAQLFATHWLNDAARNQRDLCLGWIAVKCCRAFNLHFQHQVAIDTLSKCSDQLPLEEIASKQVDLGIAFFCELGNCFRYQSNFDESLEAYEAAEKIIDHSEGDFTSERMVLIHNQAIVLRSQKRYHEAVPRLENLLNEINDTPSEQLARVLLSLAVAYYELNQPEKALEPAIRAYSMMEMPGQIGQRVRAAIIATFSRVMIDRMQSLPELEDALSRTQPDRPWAPLLAYCLLTTAIKAPHRLDLVARAQHFIKSSSAVATHPPVMMSLAEWYFRVGETDTAKQIIDRLARLIGPRRLWPWQICHLQARLLPEQDIRGRWSLLESALRSVETEAPDEAGQEYLSAWLSDKDEFQRDLLQTAVAAVRQRHASPIALIDVYEFLNAREIRFGGPNQNTGGMGTGDLFQRLSKVFAIHPAKLFFFVEGREAIHVVCADIMRSAHTRIIAELPTRAIQKAAALFFKRVPFVVTGMEQEIEGVLTESLRMIGGTIANALEPGDHVCLLPSASLLGLPLHAMADSSGRLVLEQHPISIIPNLSTLCTVIDGRSTVTAQTTSAIVVVPKMTDTTQFKGQLDATADAIHRYYGTLKYDLRGNEATITRCCQAIADVDQIVLLCHGANAGSFKGTGFCLSDGEVLPPALLPVEEHRDLKRFILDISDLGRVPHTPSLVCSVACSSGRTRSGSGGTHIGLERLFYSKGTRTIVSPLWDVEQQSSLAFIELFLKNLQTAHEKSTLAQAYQQACLSIREIYPALFQWAAFSLNGNWI
ncbi:MAG: CHAT domain-containing protein [Planctomycetaceae bacterium]|nr:CHAT domain-containing protein [Planctomycetaceae bacterium]